MRVSRIDAANAQIDLVTEGILFNGRAGGRGIFDTGWVCLLASRNLCLLGRAETTTQSQLIGTKNTVLRQTILNSCCSIHRHFMAALLSSCV